MTDNPMREPGLVDVLTAQAMKSPTPYAPVLDLGNRSTPEPEEGKGLQIVFDEKTADTMREIANDLGFDNLPNFLMTAASIYGQMLGAAINQGYTTVIMANPETEDCIEVPLVKKDDVSADGPTD